MPDLPGLKAMGAPDALDLLAVMPQVFGHHRRGLLRRHSRWITPDQFHQLLDNVRAQGGRDGCALSR